MKRVFPFLFILFFTLVKSLAQPVVTSIILPKFMADTTKGTGQGPRTPFVFRAKLSGLTANATYRYETKAISLYYINGATPAFDGPASSGAGNPIYIHQIGDFTLTSNPSFTTLGGYDSLTANTVGEYEGWFAIEPTGNARFAAGNYFHPRIIINNGVTGNSSTLTYLTISDSIRTMSYGTSTAQGSGIWSKSLARDKNIAVLWDNTAASGRPLSCAIIENDGVSYKSAATPTNYPLFYRSNVDSVSSAWGTIIPNNNSAGVRRIDNRNLSDGSLYYSNIDADGIWPTGSVSTANPSSGYSAIKLETADVPLIPNPTFYFNKINYSINESGIAVVVEVKKKYTATSNKTVIVSVKNGGTASSGIDYTFSSTTLTFSTTDTVKTISIPITDDALIEGNETFFLRLGNPGAGADIGVDSITTVTIVDDDFPLPVVSLSTTKQTISEWNNTAIVTVILSAPAPTPASVTISASNGTATSGDYSFTTTTLNFGTGDSVKTALVNINDDAIQEPTEYFIMQLSNPFKSVLGNTQDTVYITDNDYPRFPIAQISSVNSVTGVADSLGKKYDEAGIVYGINYRPSGLQFVLRDNTGGITVFKTTGNFGYTVKEKDSVRITGTVAQFNGLTEFNADTILVLGNNKVIKTPTVITKLTEANENDLVRINGVEFDVPITTWPSVASNISVHNATDSMIIRLQAANADILGTAAPQGSFDVIGLGSQFDNTSPYTSGYQLFPRFLSDIIPTAPPTTISVDTSNLNINENVGTISFKFKINNVNGNAATVILANTGTAQQGTDFTTSFNTLTFPSNAANGDSIMATYTIIDDSQVESSETIIIGISASFNTVVVGKSKTIIITDNDVAPAKITIDSLPVTVNENVGIVRVKVKISNVNGLAAAATLSFNGTATNGVDYIATPNTINFPATAANGDSIMVAYAIVDDAVHESTTETIITTITAGTNATINGGSVQTISIIDNDPNGINSNKQNRVLKIYPNPSYGTLHIVCTKEMKQLHLVDMKGNEILMMNPVSHEALLQNLGSGLYCLLIQTEDGITSQLISVR